MNDYDEFIKSIKKLKIQKPQVKIPSPVKEKAKPAPLPKEKPKKPKEKPQNNDDNDDDIFIIKSTKEYFVPDSPPKEKILTEVEIKKKQIQESVYKKVYEETRRKLAEEREQEERAKKLGIYIEPTRKQIMANSAPMKYSAMITPAVDIIRAQQGKARNYNPGYE